MQKRTEHSAEQAASKTEPHPPDEALIRAFASCRTAAEVASFLADLCTPQEQAVLSERWHIARLLYQGDLSYREISRRTGASTTTVGRVARFLRREDNGGYRSLLSRLEEGDTK